MSATSLEAEGDSLCQAFHPLDNQNSVTVLSIKAPPLVLEDSPAALLAAPRVQKEAYFHICLDTSGSMAGSGLYCAREAMARLIDHLINTCGVPSSRITVYLFSHVCKVRQLQDEAQDKAWVKTINADGGTSFACVFKELVANTQKQIREGEQLNADINTTLFFFTDGEDYDAHNLPTAKDSLESILKGTPRLESTVHTFGFTAGHDAKLLSWLTRLGTEDGCFQYIEQSGAINSSMSTTLELLGDSAMDLQRKIEILLPNDEEDATSSQHWIPIKLERDGVSGTAVVRDKVFTGNTIKWREYRPAPAADDLVAATAANDSDVHHTVNEMQVEWLQQDDHERILGMTVHIQHEFLRLVEAINTIGGSTDLSAVEKSAKLREIDNQTESYAKVLGTMTASSVKIKLKPMREACMQACTQTRTLLQSFLSVKADAHKQGGSISNTSLATFNSLAYGQITEARLKAKLDARAGKNMALFADLDDKVAKIVVDLDLDVMEAQESEDTLRELSCAFSTNTYIEALRDGDCLCMTMDVSRASGAIADPSQLVIKSIFPTLLTSSMFTLALGHSLSQNSPEDVHGGFDRHSAASIAPGLAHENITAVMPLYINEKHWQVAKLRMKPILGYVVTLDATGYTYSQSTTVPFLVLAKALEAYPMTEFKQRQILLILQTCDAIYKESKTLRETTKALVEQFCLSHTQRTVDVITNNYVFLGHVICALRAGDITVEEMQSLMPRFEPAIVEEQIRRDMSWRVSEDLMGGVTGWFNIDRQRDVVIPGQQYRRQHEAYVKSLERGNANSGVEATYRGLYKDAFAAHGHADPEAEITKAAATSPSSVTASLSVASPGEVLPEPEFPVPELDAVRWELSEGSLERLSLIQNAVSTCVDKIRRLLDVVRSPLDADLTRVLKTRLGAVAPTYMADEFFARYSRKTSLATLLQAYAHTRNSDRRSVENLMTPFEQELVDGDVDQDSPQALQFLKSLYYAKMSQMIGEVVVSVQEAYLESRKNEAAAVFIHTEDLQVAAGVLLESRYRGGVGGQLVTLCAHSRMVQPRAKIQMMLSGTYNGVRLFSDKSGTVEDIRWYPCKKTLYRMFTNHHEEFTLNEWRQFHPNRYDDYFAKRYVLDGYASELPEDKLAEVQAVYARLRPSTDAQSAMRMDIDAN
ncbi:hypothetical protein BGZ67_006270 [Mortierella alpina]|nr:hypothetical protein BGZ67_006270 [Mortierella alpina]